MRSAPKIFLAVTDALQWILRIDNIIHYLDDYILVAEDPRKADDLKSRLVSTFSELGIPLEPSKLEGPAHCLVFLGIEVDTVAPQLRLPQAKMQQLLEKLQSCIHNKSLTKRELQSLVGMLHDQFVTKVVRPGRPFLRCLYAMQEIGPIPPHTFEHTSKSRYPVVVLFDG